MEILISLVLVAFAVILVSKAATGSRRDDVIDRSDRFSPDSGYYRNRSKNGRPPSDAASHSVPARPAHSQQDMLNPYDQMEAIAAVAFETVPLLNKEEARLFYALEETVKSLGTGHRLMAQISLGEIIRPVGARASCEERRRAFASINSKRIDFGVFNRYGRLVAAIEYQGSGHYQERAFMRDAVKREAIRKAGVRYLEIPKDFVRAKVQAQIRELLAPMPESRAGSPANPINKGHDPL